MNPSKYKQMMEREVIEYHTKAPPNSKADRINFFAHI